MESSKLTKLWDYMIMLFIFFSVTFIVFLLIVNPPQRYLRLNCTPENMADFIHPEAVRQDAMAGKTPLPPETGPGTEVPKET